MIRQLILITGLIFFLANCSSTPQRDQLTSEEETRFVLDRTACNKKADESARGFGKGSITWERKRQEIYDYCMINKGWNQK